MTFDKKTEAWAKRGLELEMRGITPGIIGSEARIERLKRWRLKARFYRNIVVHAAKANLKISIIEKPHLAGDHITVGMILELPLQGGSLELSGKAGAAFREFVREAVGGTRKQGRRRARRARLA